MPKNLLNLLFIVFGTVASAQVLGNLTNIENELLPFVNIPTEKT
jgi:hypothetical protein